MPDPATFCLVVSHLLVYRTNEYKKVAQSYHSLINRQRELVKLTPRDELFGREANPAKTEFQANMSRAVLLKKSVFRVSKLLSSS
mgnify:CR=1 FL=1